MPKVNFQITPSAFRYKMSRQTSNCDSLIRKIRDFYVINEHKISLEDKKQILLYLQRIERAKKVLTANVRNEIHFAIEQMQGKYRN